MSIQAVAWVLDHSESRGLARLVLISLANHAHKESAECFPALRTIAGEAGVAVNTVRTRIDELVALGEVEVVAKGGPKRATTYRLTYVSPPEHKESGNVSPRERSVSSSVTQNHHEPKTSPNGDGAALFEALFEAWTRKPYSTSPGTSQVMPKSMRNRVNAAVKEARDAGITPDEIRTRAKRYRRTWPKVELTPQALLANWDRFGVELYMPPFDASKCEHPKDRRAVLEDVVLCGACGVEL